MRNLRFCLPLCLFFVLSQALAQKTAIHGNTSATYKAASELFEKEKYGAAQKKFEEIIAFTPNGNDELRVNAEYYKALCALKLFNKDAVFLLTDFVKRHPESKWLEPAYFQLGNYYYRKKDYDKVVDYFAKVSEFRLTPEEKVEYKFKLAYSQMKLGDSVKARTNFDEVANMESEYFAPANYYLAHLNYEAKNYQTALTGFEKIVEEKGFSDIVPFYIAQIYFLQGKFDRVIEYATPLLPTATAQQAVELNKLVGESHYNRKEFATALPFLEVFAAQSARMNNNDYYQLGYCYYKTGDFEKAIKQFSPVASADSLLGQNAQYHLGDCYLKVSNKPAARNAFRAASKVDFDKKIAEDALFNYAKLAYELSFNPYHEAITAFKEYLEKYPDTERSDEANEFLFYVFLNTKNYEAGLEALNLIKNKDERLKQAHQYIAYNRAVELMLARRNDEAYDLLEQSRLYPLDKKIQALSQYWQADIRFGDNKFGEALRLYQNFQKLPGAYSSGHYDEVYYNMGYCQFKQSAYADAAVNFRKYTSKPGDEKKICDAYLRAGDCYFVSKQYELAIEFYEKANKIGLVDPDYALYQAALANGYLGRDAQKIVVLNRLQQQFPTSNFTVDATYEAGEAYFKNNENEKALEALRSLSKKFPGSQYARKGSLLTGLILYRQQKYEEAIAVFKKIAADYPSYDDAQEAIARAEDIYVELGRAEEYNDWVQSLKFYNVSTTALDSTNFRSAENIYISGDCERAKTAFRNYLAKFENGLFVTSAHFNLAECLYKDKDFSNALEHYTAVINRPANKYTEAALVAAAYLNYNLKNYTLALDNYRQLENVAEDKTNVLEAQMWQMRCYNKLNNPIDMLVYADKVLQNVNTAQKVKLEAQINKARAHMGLGDLENAAKIYTEIANTTKTVEGAEARYQLAYMLFVKGEYKKAEEAIFELVNQKPAYDNWIAKSFVMLAEVYLKMGDNFQAKATLQSVIDNHDGKELVDEARKRLLEIIELENAPKVEVVAPTELKTEGYDQKYDKLFEEDKKKTEKQPEEAVNPQPKN